MKNNTTPRKLPIDPEAYDSEDNGAVYLGVTILALFILSMAITVGLCYLIF